MLVVQSRLSLNLAALTLEQVLSRRRKMLMDMTSGIELEVRDALDPALATQGIKILNKALAYGPLSCSPDWFNGMWQCNPASLQLPLHYPTVLCRARPTPCPQMMKILPWPCSRRSTCSEALSRM